MCSVTPVKRLSGAITSSIAAMKDTKLPTVVLSA